MVSTQRVSVDPLAAAALPAVQFLRTEPQRDFPLSALHRVAAVDYVPVTQTQQKHSGGKTSLCQKKKKVK